MVATFILTRAFAIAGVIVSALPLVYTAPMGSPALEERNCRILGCFFAEPPAEASSASVVSATAAPVIPTASAEPSIASEIADVLDLLSEIVSASETQSSEENDDVAIPDEIIDLDRPEIDPVEELEELPEESDEV
ncbi:hypothetical protein IEO21_06940 [Rhodonia placenta]|uniref:Uncharacterized protein n=1 Tax=Rhodonia placenta TaxID=104341 RepID=A0A8H7NZA4_9APHY|nr:hypothetical protein IEO21_06940 [Postia placenta]